MIITEQHGCHFRLELLDTYNFILKKNWSMYTIEARHSTGFNKNLKINNIYFME